jgi:uncharacterized cysteine cluster protein YcgN (CxxCxxCC family)
MTEIRIIPFIKEINEDFDTCYIFNYLGSTNKIYKVEIIIDELADNLIKKYTCNCNDYIMRKKGKSPCNHILNSFKILSEFNIEYELPKEDAGEPETKEPIHTDIS